MKNFGYWIFGKDMYNVKLETLKKNGITDIFLNYYAFTIYGQSKVTTWIKQAKTQNINVHIWVQCFYNGDWINPKTANHTNKLAEIKKYANINGVYGIHLDYLRYPGNAYKTSGGTDAITAFVKKVRAQNPKTFLSCAVMPENEDDKKYYGQDIPALGKIVDCIIPMQYKGNYEAGTSWLKSTTKYFSKYATVWSGLQSYKSDDNPTILTANELLTDAKTCISNGAKGAIIFRYGLSPNINFTSFNTSSNITYTGKIPIKELKSMIVTLKKYIETNKKIPGKVKVGNKYYPITQVIYALTYTIIKPNVDVPIFNINKATKSTGSVFSETLVKDDYYAVVKRIFAYIRNYKKLPNYALTTTSKKKLSVSMYTYLLVRIANYYYLKKKLPSKAGVSYNFFKNTTTNKNTTTTTSSNCTGPRYISSPHFTNQGSGYLGQINSSNCGPHSIRQCLKKFNIIISESTLASWAGTVIGSGTDHEGINTAIAKAAKQAGVKIEVTWYNFSSLGSNDAARFKKLGELLCQKNVAGFLHILYSGAGDYYNPGDECGHYEALDRVNVQTKYVRALNSLGSRDGNGYYGHLQDRTFDLESKYISGISQKSVCILKLVK